MVTSGIPRVKELLYMSKNIKTPSTSIFVVPELARNESFFSTWRHLLKETFLGDLLISETVVIIWEPDPSTTLSVNRADKQIVPLHAIFHDHTVPAQDYPHSRWVIRADLNKSALVDRGLVPKDVARVLLSYFNCKGTSQNLVNASETDMDEWCLRFRVPNVRDMVQDSAHLGSCSTKKAFERDLCLSTLYQLSHTLKICGITGITGSTMREESGNTIVDTEGSNMLDVWLLDGCDWSKTVSNIIQDVHEYLGIEAACELLFYELKTVIAMASSNISDRHILLLMDVMTRHGTIVSINRHGFNQLNHAFARASFEETVDNLMDAALFAELDPMSDIVSNVAVGQTVPAGTGRVHTLLDAEYAKRAQQEMAQLRPTAEHKVIFTTLHSCLSDDIQSQQMQLCPEQQSHDPLDDWVAPPIQPSDATFMTPPVRPSVQATFQQATNTPPFQAYRPSSPNTRPYANGKSAINPAGKLNSYRPSSPESSQNCKMSPRGVGGASADSLMSFAEQEDENFVYLPEQALSETAVVIRSGDTNPRKLDPMFTQLTFDKNDWTPGEPPSGTSGERQSRGARNRNTDRLQK